MDYCRRCHLRDLLGWCLNALFCLVESSLTVHLIVQLFYAYVLSPVRHVPGPWYCRLSRLPLYRALFHAKRSAFAHRLIEKYGPIVVIAPDQVHTNDDEAMKVIYDRKSLKTPFYKKMGSWKGVTSTLGFVDYASAAPTRNNLIQCFQNRNLDILADHTAHHVLRFADIIENKCAKGEQVDGVLWFRLLALDIVTDVLWGEQTNLVSSVDASTTDFLRRFHAFSSYNATMAFIPGFDFLVRNFGTKKWKTLRSDCGDMDLTARAALMRWETSSDKGKHERDVLSMLKAMDSQADPNRRIPNDHIPAYMVEMMAAGSSTTSHTAAFLCRALAKYPKYQKKLRQELFEAFPDAESMDLTTAVQLPYVEAVIKETMRMWPMIPGPLERYLGNSITVAGKVVPPGVIASTSALDQGLLEDVYPSAREWNPDRWLDADARMKLNWTPFGYGSRICPGQNLAMTELRYMVSAIFRRMTAIPCPGHENEALELKDVFAAGTVSGHLWLKFEINRGQVA